MFILFYLFMKNYSRLRLSRGTDSAVVELWNESKRQELVDILENPQAFSRNDLIKQTISHYSWKDFAEAQWRMKTGWWTTPEEATILGRFFEIYPQWYQLGLI